jgi:hypothetical protein
MHEKSLTAGDNRGGGGRAGSESMNFSQASVIARDGDLPAVTCALPALRWCTADDRSRADAKDLVQDIGAQRPMFTPFMSIFVVDASTPNRTDQDPRERRHPWSR